MRRQTASAEAPASAGYLVHNPWFLALILMVATFLVYQSTWHAGFIWDDSDHLTANPAMTAPHGLQLIWSSLAVSRYYPLTLTTFWFEHWLWGFSPMPFHLVNIVFHAVNGVLVFLILRRLQVPAAWLAAMLWVLHPVNVESVAWITELKNTQSGLFFFLSMWCFLRFDVQKNYRWYAAALLCGVAAMFSKPSTVVLPLALLLCVGWERGGWRRTDMARIVPFFGLALGMSILTVIEQRGHIDKTGPADWKLEMAQRFIIAGKAIWFYAAKLLWPSQLTFVYPRWSFETRSPLSWAPLVGLITVSIVLWTMRRQVWARAGVFGFGFFVAALLPILGFFDVYYFLYSFVADHFQYLASVGLITLAASAGAALYERIGPLGRRFGAIAATALLVTLGGLTWRQGQVYHDVETLWRDTIAKNPDCWMARFNLANLLFQTSRMKDAIGQYEQAVRLKPTLTPAQTQLSRLRKVQ